MKLRLGFVSNSSSTAYIITNKTNETKDLVDFVQENPELVDEYFEEYGEASVLTRTEMEGVKAKKNPVMRRVLQEDLIRSARENNFVFDPHTGHYIAFGDEDGTLIGRVFDYILRDGGESKSFRWRFKEALR